MIEKGTVILSLEQYESLKEWEKMHDDLEINVDNLKENYMKLMRPYGH